MMYSSIKTMNSMFWGTQFCLHCNHVLVRCIITKFPYKFLLALSIQMTLAMKLVKSKIMNMLILYKL